MQKHLTKLLSLILICCFLLAGCGEENSRQNQNNLTNVTYFTETEALGRSYHVNEQNLDITSRFSPKYSSLQTRNQMLYFENLSDPVTAIYRKSLSENSTPERLPITFSESDTLLNFVVDETGTVYCFLQTAEGYYSFQSYDQEGGLLAQQDITQFASTNQEYFFLDHLMVDSEGIIYGSQDNAIWMFRPDGQFLGRIEIPEPPILDMCIGKDGTAYVTYYANHYQVTMAAIDTDNCCLGSAVSIPGTGRLFTGIHEDLLTYDSQYLYEISADTGEYTVLLDLMQHYIDSAPICLLWGTSDTALQIITWQIASDNVSEITMKHLLLTEGSLLSDSTASQEKENIHIIAPGSSGDPDFVNFVMEFNKQSDKYHVTYEAMEFADEQAFSSYLNTRLVSRDCPDLIVTGHYYYQLFAEAAVLEDLTPYLNQSTDVSKEDYLDTVIEAFEVDQSLYGIPKSFNLFSLAGRKSQVKDIHRKGIWPFSIFSSREEEQTGMTIDDFLSFLEKHPEAKFEWDGGPWGLLRYCLKYSLDSYVDFENGISYLGGEDFRNLLTRLKEMERTHSAEPGTWSTLIEDGELVIPHIAVFDFYTLAGTAYDYGEELTLLGYPSSDGSLRCELLCSNVMCILGNSADKEGAWEFMEYYLQYYETPSSFPSTKEGFHEALETATTKKYKEDTNGKKVEAPVSQHFYNMDLVPIYALSEKEAEHIVTAVENAKPISKETKQIIEIILEECDGYFYSSKSLDDVLAIIQSRVQLYLDENL